jgi:hypothetical protein
MISGTTGACIPPAATGWPWGSYSLSESPLGSLRPKRGPSSSLCTLARTASLSGDHGDRKGLGLEHEATAVVWQLATELEPALTCV